MLYKEQKMKGKRMFGNVMKAVYLLVALGTICEYSFISGLFTGPIMMALTIVFGIINLIIAIKDQDVLLALLYVVSTIALNMGYLQLMIQ